MEHIVNFDGFLNEELSRLQIEYREYFKYLLSQYEVSSPSQLSTEKKAEFFAEIKKNWKKGVGLKVKNFIKTNESTEPEDVYQNSLKDDYWKEVGDNFPNYNTTQAYAAADWVLQQMKEKYPTADWENIEKQVLDKIRSGLT